MLVRLILGFMLGLSVANQGFAGEGARIFIYRYRQFVGAAISPSVYCDEIQLARMENGRYFVTLPPGKHTFRSNDTQSGIELDSKDYQEYYIRVEITTGFAKGHGRLVVTPPEQGSYEVRKLKPLDPDKIKDGIHAISAVSRRNDGDSQPLEGTPLTNADVSALKAAGMGSTDHCKDQELS
jgi:hypothetical protein